MQYVRPAVATTCVGRAVGAGAVLLTAGSTGRRLALPHTRVVLYQPSTLGRRRDTDHDRVSTAAETQTYGLIDHVVTRR